MEVSNSGETWLAGYHFSFPNLQSLPSNRSASIMSCMSPTPPHELQLLRFGLRQMFFSVTLLCVLMALLVLTKGPWPIAIGAVTALIAAHVFATFVGTRLRDTTQEVEQWRAANRVCDEEALQGNLRFPEAAKSDLPPPTPSSEVDELM